MVNACINTLHEITKENPNVVVMGADSMNIAKVFRGTVPMQYIEMGIAENNLIGAAAGFSTCGCIPFVYAVAPFLVYRALEFIRDDICLQKRNVKIIAYSAGMDYCTSGPTHHTTEDIAILRSIPNLTVLSPGSVREVEEMIKASLDIEGPVYIRLARERNREFQNDEYQFELGVPDLLRDGKDVTVFSTGSITYDVLKAADIALAKGICARVFHLGTIKPLRIDILTEILGASKYVLTVEENTVVGGIGGMISEIIAEMKNDCYLKRIGLSDTFAKGYGNHDEVKKINKMDINTISEVLCSFKINA